MLNRKSFEKEPPLWIITAQGLLYAQHLLLFTLQIYSAFQMQNFLECTKFSPQWLHLQEEASSVYTSSRDSLDSSISEDNRNGNENGQQTFFGKP